MDPNYARKLSTETLTNRLNKQPFNVTILNELNKRATKVFKCEIQAKIRLEKELAKRSNRAVIGHKNEAYFTEYEMINGFSCTYEQLSESEKSIFDKL